MADQVTTATEKTPEQIEQEMHLTRESLSEKVGALEHQVAGTVEAVKSFVTNAPEAMSDGVKQAAAAVNESMREAFDISAHVRRHPLVAVGTSALLGCLASWLLFRDSGNNASRITSRMAEAAPPVPTPAEPARAASSNPGLLDELFGMLGDKAKELARSTLDTVAASLKESIQTQVPRVVNDASARLAENCVGSDDASLLDRLDARRGSM